MAPTLKTSPRRHRGGSSVEYILVLALVVIPLGLLVTTLVLKHMMPRYMERITTVVSWPIG